MRTLRQLLEKDPLSAAELKEMTIRHILADPDNPSSAEVTYKLLSTYINLRAKESRPCTLLSEDEADKCMRDYYRSAAGSIKGYSWPAAIPRPSASLPRDILVEIGCALGNQAIGEPDTN